MTVYDAAFYQLEEQVAVSSARRVLPWVLDMLRPSTVVDVGCGTGGWAYVAEQYGCTVAGFDSYDGPTLIGNYTHVNLEDGVSCAGYDLAICLEVGEHLPAKTAPRLVAGLCEARYVLFSAAIPGQNGVHHINEAWSTWWANLFAKHGYVGTCDPRWYFWNDREIADFYRQNLIVFASLDDLAAVGWSPGVVDVVHPQRMGNW